MPKIIKTYFLHLMNTGLAHIPLSSSSFGSSKTTEIDSLWSHVNTRKKKNNSNINCNVISNADSLIGHDLAKHLSKCLNLTDLSGT